MPSLTTPDSPVPAAIAQPAIAQPAPLSRPPMPKGAARRASAWPPVRRGRLLVVGLRRRWRRSLQLRMVTYTLLASSVLVITFGVLVVTRTASGLLQARTTSAVTQIESGAGKAHSQLNQITAQDDPGSVTQFMQSILPAPLEDASGQVQAIIFPPNGLAVPVAHSSASDLSEQVPDQLRSSVRSGHIAHVYVDIEPGPSLRSKPFLVVGAPVFTSRGPFELYYLYPLDAEVTSSTITRNTVLVIGTALVLLLAILAWLVTRMVVRPVRHAARTAQRLSAGLLDQRMDVHGEDDLARLAAAFNQMAANLQRQIIRLEEMSRLQRRFTSDVSHELRTPLTTVRMAADLIYGSRDDLDPLIGRSAELLNKELDRFEDLLTDLLEISRFDAGFAVLDAEPTDFVSMVRRVVDRLAPVADRVGVRVDVRVPEMPVIAEVDPRRVERIVRNLVGNAVEHGEGRPVLVTLASDDSAVAVTVRDHGIGLKPAEEKLVFNRFWRADPSRARQTGGTGLGLSISLEDARLHGGWLEAWGAPGLGAQFRLVVPARAGGRLTTAPLALVPADVDIVSTSSAPVAKTAADSGRPPLVPVDTPDAELARENPGATYLDGNGNEPDERAPSGYASDELLVDELSAHELTAEGGRG